MIKFVVPETESPPRKPAPVGETYIQSLQRKAVDAEARGECVTMNTLWRSIPPPKRLRPRG